MANSHRDEVYLTDSPGLWFAPVFSPLGANVKKLRRTLRAAAIAAGIAWLVLCWLSFTKPETMGAQEARTAFFVMAFACASFGWPTRPRKPGSRRKERF